MILNKTDDLILPYTYLLKFNISGTIKYYYGVRYGNVRLNLPPSQDLFVKYFTSSSSVKNLIESNIYPDEIIIHKIFNTPKEACEYEVNFLTRVNAKNRNDFLNLTNHFDNSLPYSNKGRIMSESTKKKISKSSTKFQNTEEYREYRRNLMLSKWKSIEFRNKMNSINSSFWSSDTGKSILDKTKTNWIGRTHTDETKRKMSESAKSHLTGVDMRERALNRKRYTCPLCKRPNLDGGNFNSHMISNHSWNKDECANFKKNYPLNE